MNDTNLSFLVVVVVLQLLFGEVVVVVEADLKEAKNLKQKERPLKTTSNFSLMVINCRCCRILFFHFFAAADVHLLVLLWVLLSLSEHTFCRGSRSAARGPTKFMVRERTPWHCEMLWFWVVMGAGFLSKLISCFFYFQRIIIIFYSYSFKCWKIKNFSP